MNLEVLKLVLLVVTAPIWWKVLRAFREELVAFLAADAARQRGEGWIPDADDPRLPARDPVDLRARVRTRLTLWDDTGDPTWSKTRLVNRAWDSGRPAHRPPPSFKDVA